MRNLKRPPANLPTLTGKGKGARVAAKHVRLRAREPNAPLTFPSHWTEADIRGALLAFHGRVCAYCQCELPRNDPGAVEHFRPKSVYWWLAYSFTNYFLSCRVCNSECKLERFPLASGTAPCTFAERDRLEEEKRLLLDPSVDEVEDWVHTNFKDPMCRVAPTQELDSAGDPYLRTRTTIEFFKLNQDPRLTGERIKAILHTLKLLALKDSTPTVAEEVRKMASRYRPHGLAVRQLLASAKVEGTLVPSPADELLMFGQDLLGELELAERALHDFPQSRPARRLQGQILWALAVLWKFPPEGNPPDLIELLLARHDCRDKVAQYCARI